MTVETTSNVGFYRCMTATQRATYGRYYTTQDGVQKYSWSCLDNLRYYEGGLRLSVAAAIALATTVASTIY